MNTLGRSNESQRVFQLGPECYIVYLGSDRDDDDPFLRIGNSPDLPELLHKLTSKIVLTSSYTGNPFQEVEYARRHKLSYLGDVDVIEHFRKFFQGMNLPARDLNDYRQLKAKGENRHTLYFYNNGNIHLNFDNNLIFDLQKREEQDLHLNQKCDRIKALLLKNPLRYTREDLGRAGFFISEQGKFYLIDREWTALDLEEHYYASLASQGIDADEVNTLFTSVSEDKMVLPDREAMVQLIKRHSLRMKSMTVLTTSLEITDHLLHLFPESPRTRQVQPVLMEEGKEFSRDSMKAAVSEGILRIDFGKKNQLIVPFGEGAGKPRWEGWHISRDRRTLTHRTKEGVETELNTLPGFPLILEHSLPSGTALVNKYLSFFHTYLESWQGRDVWQKLYDLEEAVRDILGGASAESVLRASFSRIDVHTPGLEYLFIHNCYTLISQTSEKTEALDALKQSLERMKTPSPLLPVLGDLYTGKNGPFILYRITSSTMNPHNFRKAEEVSAQIKRVKSSPSSVYEKERDRLHALLENLYGAGPAVTRPAPPKSAESSRGGAKTEIREAPNKEAESPRSHGFDQRPARPQAVKKRSILPLILVLALLLAGGAGAFFLLKGGAGAKDAEIRTAVNIEKSGESSSAGSGKGSLESSARQEGDDSGGSAEADPDGGAAAVKAGGSAGDVSTPDGSGSDAASAAGDRSSLASPESVTAEEPGSRDGAVTQALENREGQGAAVESSGSADAAIGPDRSSGISEGSKPSESSGQSEGSNPSGSTGISAVSVSDEPVIVETERRPRTVDEALAYLKIEGIEITLVDIHLVSNDIAVRNGYRDLDYMVDEGEDPDWIYPGNVLEMPDGTDYTVVRGDNIWFLSSRLIRRELERDLEILAGLEGRLSDGNLDDSGIKEIRTVLKDLDERTFSEQFRARVSELLKSLE